MQDPWALAAQAEARSVQARNDGKDSTYEYKPECIRILLSGVSQSILRSVAMVFDITRQHQLWVAKHGHAAKKSIKYLLFWAHPRKYLEVIVVPTVANALSGPSLATLGLSKEVSCVLAGANQEEEEAKALTDTQEIFKFHMLLIFELAWQWWVYELLPQSPPWSYVLLLSDIQHVRADAAAAMRDCFILFNRLESSRHPFVQKLLPKLHFRTWPVVREPLELLEKEGWSEDAPRAREYVRECCSDFTHTLMEEEAFNDLRDDEGRGARHKQRGEHHLTAKVLSSAHTRYIDAAQVDIEASDLGSHERTMLRASAFHPELLKRDRVTLGVDVGSITAEGTRQWTSTSFDNLALTAMTLFRALQLAPEAEWPNLWMAGLVDRHVVVASEDGIPYFVLGATKSLIVLWEIEELDGSLFRLIMRADAFSEATVTHFEQYVVYNAECFLRVGHDATEVMFRLGAATSILRSCVCRNMHKLDVETLRHIAAEIEAPKLKGSTQSALVRHIVEFLGYDDTREGQRCMALAEARYQKRRAAMERRKREAEKAGQGDDADSASVASDSSVEEPGGASALLKKVCPAEFDYMIGKIAGGACINEEEDGPELAKYLPKAAGPKPKPKPKAKRKAKAKARSSSRSSGSSSGSSGSSSSPSPGPDHEPPVPMPPEPAAPEPAAPDEMEVAPEAPEPELLEPLPPDDPPEEAAAVAVPPDGPAVDAVVGAAAPAFAALLREPRDEDYRAPARCSFRKYPYRIEAKLPKGVQFNGRNSRSRDYGPTIRSEALAFAECKSFLDGAVLAGLVAWP